MRALRSLWRGAFDVRPGEHSRIVLLGLYFASIMVASNILKPVSWGLFLNRFDASRLPYLYILIAAAGGLVSYLYTRVAVVASLEAAVATATAVCVALVLVFWALIDVGSSGLLYAFSVFVSLVGLVFLAQGWLIAGTLFDSREAKRLYGLLGLGAILGAAAGSSVTALAAARWGTKNLLLAAALFVAIAYCSLKGAAIAARRSGPVRPTQPQLAAARQPFRFRDLAVALARYRHLQAIVGLIAVTFCVEVLAEFQFNALAKEAFSGDQLTAFLGRFNVLLSGVTFFLQVFLTTLVVARLGVGRTLAIAPLAVGTASIGVLAAPGLLAASLTRLGEAATRYSINRTAIELLYLPLPADLKARTKAFVDVVMDRFGRGVAALMLLGLTAAGWAAPQRLSLVLVVLAGGWLMLAWHARREYTATVRRRIEARRLNLAEARVSVQDSETLRLLEHVASGPNPRQVIYALSLLGEAPRYEPGPLLEQVIRHPAPEVRAKVYELARAAGYPGLLSRALDEVRAGRALPPELAAEAVAYVLAVSPQAEALASELLAAGDPVVAEAVLRRAAKRGLIETLVSDHWVIARAHSNEPALRALAAVSLGLRGRPAPALLLQLLDDPVASVALAAIGSAGRLGCSECLETVIRCLGQPRRRGAAIEALIAYGEWICSVLAAHVLSETSPLRVRRQIPRVLAGLASQSAAEALERCLAVADIEVRAAVLKALSKLRQRAPQLQFDRERITDQIRREAGSYYELYASLERFRASRPGGPAADLLARTLEARLDQTLDRLFRLLGLQYPPGPIYAAYRAVVHRRREELGSAIEFLDSVLEPRLKSILLPVVDGSPYLIDVGRDVFGIQIPDLEAAIRHQIRRDDPWLVACAVAAAAELRLSGLKADIAVLARRQDGQVAPVARRAEAALA